MAARHMVDDIVTMKVGDVFNLRSNLAAAQTRITTLEQALMTCDVALKDAATGYRNIVELGIVPESYGIIAEDIARDCDEARAAAKAALDD